MKSLIAFLSTALLFGLLLTVSPGSYGTTDNDCQSIENPVYSSDIDLIPTFETVYVLETHAAYNVEISTAYINCPIEDNLAPDTQGILNRSESILTSFVSVVRLAYYKQDYSLFVHKNPAYG